jgi:hypothetical protein
MSDSNPPMPRWVDTVSAILLSVAGLSTAWASYQASLWGGEQISYYSLASAKLTNASQLDIVASQTAGFDTTLFVAWIDSALSGDTDRKDFLERRFSPAFSASFLKWRPTMPAELKGYRLPPGTVVPPLPAVNYPQSDEARALRDEAGMLFEKGEAANRNSDRFVAITVLLSTVLFLAGISQLLQRPKPRIAMLGLSGVLLVTAVAWLLGLPTSGL